MLKLKQSLLFLTLTAIRSSMDTSRCISMACDYQISVTIARQ